MITNGVQYEITLKDLFTPAIRNADKEANKFEKSVNDLNRTIGQIKGAAITAFGGWGIKEIGGHIIDVTRRMDRLRTSLNFIEGGKGPGAERFAYLEQISEDLGLNLESAAKGYKYIAAAARGTRLEGQGVADIFEAVSGASTVLQLSSEETEGALLAISQMMSKGKVQAEELRGQLGERIPGAFQIAARAMNMTTAELDKFMADGNLVAETFLPRFAKQIKEEFASGIPEASRTLGAELNRLNTDFFTLGGTFGEELRPAILGTIDTLREGIAWMSDNKDVLITWGKIISKVTVAYYGWRAASLVARGAETAWLFLLGVETTKTAQATGATQAHTFAIAELTGALEALAIAQTQVAGTSATLYNAQGMAMASLPAGYETIAAANAALLQQQASRAAAGQAVAAGAGIGATAVGAIGAVGIPVIIVGLAASVAAALLPDNEVTGESWGTINLLHVLGKRLRRQLDSSQSENVLDDDEKGLEISVHKALAKFGYDNPLLYGAAGMNKVPTPYSWSYAMAHPGLMSGMRPANSGERTHWDSSFSSGVDKVRGQKVININIVNQKGMVQIDMKPQGLTQSLNQLEQVVTDVVSNAMNNSQRIADSQ